MNLADIPPLVPIPFANNAGSSYIRPIPLASQIGVQVGAASFTDGFTPDTFQPLSGGGAYVNGEDVNGILNHITKWTRWLGAGGAAVYNATFATSIGGYPQGAMLVSTAFGGRVWMSTADGNLTDPDGAGAANWIAVGPLAATLAQAEAGTDTTTFLTPAVLQALLQAMVVPAYGQTGNGYWEKNPATGIITQWGYLASTSGGGPYNFPIPFSTGCSLFLTSRNNLQSSEKYFDAPWGKAVSQTQFTAGTKDVNSGNTTGYDVAWYAKGI